MDAQFPNLRSEHGWSGIFPQPGQRLKRPSRPRHFMRVDEYLPPGPPIDLPVRSLSKRIARWSLLANRHRRQFAGASSLCCSPDHSVSVFGFGLSNRRMRGPLRFFSNGPISVSHSTLSRRQADAERLRGPRHRPVNILFPIRAAVTINAAELRPAKSYGRRNPGDSGIDRPRARRRLHVAAPVFAMRVRPLTVTPPSSPWKASTCLVFLRTNNALPWAHDLCFDKFWRRTSPIAASRPGTCLEMRFSGVGAMGRIALLMAPWLLFNDDGGPWDPCQLGVGKAAEASYSAACRGLSIVLRPLRPCVFVKAPQQVLDTLRRKAAFESTFIGGAARVSMFAWDAGPGPH